MLIYFIRLLFKNIEQFKFCIFISQNDLKIDLMKILDEIIKKLSEVKQDIIYLFP